MWSTSYVKYPDTVDLASVSISSTDEHAYHCWHCCSTRRELHWRLLKGGGEDCKSRAWPPSGRLSLLLQLKLLQFITVRGIFGYSTTSYPCQGSLLLSTVVKVCPGGRRLLPRRVQCYGGQQRGGGMVVQSIRGIKKTLAMKCFLTVERWVICQPLEDF